MHSSKSSVYGAHIFSIPVANWFLFSSTCVANSQWGTRLRWLENVRIIQRRISVRSWSSCAQDREEWKGFVNDVVLLFFVQHFQWGGVNLPNIIGFKGFNNTCIGWIQRFGVQRVENVQNRCCYWQPCIVKLPHCTNIWF